MDFAWTSGSLRCGLARLVGPLIAALCVLAPHPAMAQTRAALFERVEDIAAPAPGGAHEPSLTHHDGALFMSWMERAGEETRVMMATRSGEDWSEARPVQRGADLFVNWADFPRIAVFGDGTIAVHWLRQIGASSYDYRVEIALSRDGGASWSAPLIPHADRSLAQHGFVSMLPVGRDDLAVIWLDARAYGNGSEGGSAPDGSMQLRATTLTSAGVLGADEAVDLQTCSCCQTDLAAAGDGTILAVYRDRTGGEIRDISVARRTAEGWQAPVPVHDDGWELAGCPVNGPAIAADGDRAAVAWFTGAQDRPAVKVAFSDDAGRSFGAPMRVDHGNPVGRVDLDLLEDGSALVSWVEGIRGREALLVCRVTRDTGCVAEGAVSVDASGGSVNFPTMARLGRDVYLAFTASDARGDRIAMLRATLTRIDWPDVRPISPRPVPQAGAAP